MYIHYSLGFSLLKNYDGEFNNVIYISARWLVRELYPKST